jgi:hypothetical protein
LGLDCKSLEQGVWGTLYKVLGEESTDSLLLRYPFSIYNLYRVDFGHSNSVRWLGRHLRLLLFVLLDVLKIMIRSSLTITCTPGL